MPIIAPTLPNDGETIDASDVNGPLNAILGVLNGSVDSDNLATGAVSSVKIANGAVTGVQVQDKSIDLGAKASQFDGWVPVIDTWTFATANTVTVPTDATVKYSIGDLVKFTQGGVVKYFRITLVAATVITLLGEASATVANSAITAISYSKVATPQGAPLNNTPWFQEIGRTTLTVAGNTISVTSIPPRKYLKILVSAQDTGGTIGAGIQFNGDNAANYTQRDSTYGAADASSTGNTTFFPYPVTAACPVYIELSVINILAFEKLIQGNSTHQNTVGVANVPGRREISGKWANTAAQITRVDATNLGGGNFAIGSEVIVLGHN